MCDLNMMISGATEQLLHRVYRAVNVEDHRVAACKMVTLTDETTETERKTLDKEMRVHTALKHDNVLEFYSAYIVEPNKPSPYHPGIYMLLEMAAGGDLFDKIGVYDNVQLVLVLLTLRQLLTLA